ncbi:MAG: hypothetical protein JKY53_02750 [Flavobacteriales bacterium]|nr:hypothetical protein [Flavobacteriales bacterium]
MITKFRYIHIVTISVVIIALGFIRDSLFKHINYQIYRLNNSSEEIIGSDFYQVLFENLDTGQLLTLKWILTLLFVLVYYILTFTGIRLIYSSKKYHRLILIVFAVIFMLSGLSYLTGWLTNNLELGYRFSRILMGAIQSPFILLILIPGIKILERTKITAKN